MELQAMSGYWNHNSAYHPWICDIARARGGSVLDVGCGEGLLLQRLAPLSESVTGIDPDPAAVAKARLRVAALDNVTVRRAGLLEYETQPGSFDLVTFVASLHHLDLTKALRRARMLVKPGGEVVVVGLAANKAAMDWVRSGLQLPVVRFGGWIHHERRDVDVVAVAPKESFGEIRALVGRELPGAHLRRGLYYRYLLRWRKS